MGDRTVVPTLNRIVRDGRELRVEPKAMRLLVYLAKRQGEVASREELMRVGWPDTCVTDDALKRCVSELRKALGDSRVSPRFIETIPKGGYRLIAPVLAEPVLVKESAGDRSAPKTGGAEVPRRPVRRWSVVGALSAAVVIFGAISIMMLARPAVPTRLEPQPLTGMRGVETSPAFSPDGSRIAFVSVPPDGRPPDLYVRLLEGGSLLRLTSGTHDVHTPAWSPNGQSIVFLRHLGQAADAADFQHALVQVPALGGAETTLGTARTLRGRGLNWSPDGQVIALVDRIPPEPDSIFLLEPSSGARTRLTVPPRTSWGDSQPAFSPDGRRVAFIRESRPYTADIVVQSPGGTPQTVARFGRLAQDLDWTAEGSALIVAVEEEGRAALWRVSVDGGEPTRIPVGEDGHAVTIDRNRDRLAYGQIWRNCNIWRASGPAASKIETPVRLLDLSRRDWGPKFSPDGERIAFVSEQSGDFHVWVCRSDGSNCRQLAPGPPTEVPRWSPDGRRIAFVRRSNGNYKICVVDADGGMPRELTRGTGLEYFPFWSADGRWVYFQSAGNIWKVRAEGGEPIRVTTAGGDFPQLSDDGRWLYYMRTPPGGRAEVWRMRLDGGPPESLPARWVHRHQWEVWRSDVIFFHGALNREYEVEGEVDRPTVQQLDVNTGLLKTIREFESTRICTGFDVSPDGRWIVYSQLDSLEGDIILVNNFQDPPATMWRWLLDWKARSVSTVGASSRH